MNLVKQKNIMEMIGVQQFFQKSKYNISFSTHKFY